MIINASLEKGIFVIPEKSDLWYSHCPVNTKTFETKNGVMRPALLSDYDGLLIKGDIVENVPVLNSAYYEDSNDFFNEYGLVYDLNSRAFVAVGTASFYSHLDFSDKSATRSTAIPQIGALVTFGGVPYVITSVTGNFKASANPVGSSGYGFFVGNVRIEEFAG